MANIMVIDGKRRKRVKSWTEKRTWQNPDNRFVRYILDKGETIAIAAHGSLATSLRGIPDEIADLSKSDVAELTAQATRACGTSLKVAEPRSLTIDPSHDKVAIYRTPDGEELRRAFVRVEIAPHSESDLRVISPAPAKVPPRPILINGSKVDVLEDSSGWTGGERWKGHFEWVFVLETQTIVVTPTYNETLLNRLDAIDPEVDRPVELKVERPNKWIAVFTNRTWRSEKAKAAGVPTIGSATGGKAAPEHCIQVNVEKRDHNFTESTLACQANVAKKKEHAALSNRVDRLKNEIDRVADMVGVVITITNTSRDRKHDVNLMAECKRLTYTGTMSKPEALRCLAAQAVEDAEKINEPERAAPFMTPAMAESYRKKLADKIPRKTVIADCADALRKRIDRFQADVNKRARRNRRKL